MKFSYLLPFIGIALAVPAPNPSYPSIFDNPTIPIRDLASLKDLPALSHIRRAEVGTQQTFLNISCCDVTIKGETGFYRAWKARDTQGHLYITEGIPSPGTKNGANIYDVYLQSGTLAAGGGIMFTTNRYLLSLPNRLGTSPSVDYARVSMTKDGYILSEVDYSNIDNPGVNSPLRFTSEPSIGNAIYGPPTRYLAYGPSSYLGVKFSDKGNNLGTVDGVVQLFDVSAGLRYVARIAGYCFNVRNPVTV
ncbi:hypothetical protein FGADI_2780 [Fusarium gaditjirri]|uniref:Uncharacterized protein n=1 Tax=Fusarium gaditjirri TaxID=282569 RepID=A0A8H4THE7_9HYPO|nr:hypothetical protein FGADI_2780 [Fusarium gaditjirri]